MKNEQVLSQQGFSIIELLVTIGIISILLGFVVVNLASLRNSASLNSSLDTLTADLRQQQIKSMLGDTEGRKTQTSYGIYFQANQYVMFNGASYNPSDTTNYTVKMDPSIEILNIVLPSLEIVFASGSGEFSSYTSGADSVTLHNIHDNNRKTIKFNKYGTITFNN